MEDVDYSGFAEKYLKALKEEERQICLHYIQFLASDKARIIIDTGMQIHQSSAVNGTWFWRTVPILANSLQEEDFLAWLNEGSQIGRGNWECTLAFLKVSFEIVKQVTPNTFLNWVKIGKFLARFNHQEALWFFKHSEDIFSKLSPEEQNILTQWVLKLIEYSWEAAFICWKVWPQIVPAIEPEQRNNILSLGLQLAKDIPDDASGYFKALPYFLKCFNGEHISYWVEAAYINKNVRRGVITEFFDASPGLVIKVPKHEFKDKFIQWAKWGNQLASINNKVAEAFFKTTPLVLQKLEWNDLQQWVILIELVNRDYSQQGAEEFIKITPELLQQLDIKEVAGWVEYGLVTLKEDSKKVYFTLKSQESRDTILRLRRGLFLETIQKVLLFYYQGLTGKSIILRKANELPAKIHGHASLFSTLDTRRIYLPDLIKLFEDYDENLRIYRAMFIHQASHMEFGSLLLSKEEFRELATNKTLGLIFEYLEDNRIDYLAMKSYPGFAKDLKILLERGIDKKGENSSNHPLLSFLKYYLWNDPHVFEHLISPEVHFEIKKFWIKVTESGSSAKESLQTARKIHEIISGENQGNHQLLADDNLLFRGQLKYDLIYVSMTFDEEINQDSQISQHTHDEVPNGNIELHSDVYIALKKRLVLFYEDEQNPYRLIAYYDEWDRSLSDYKKDWCKVREILLKPSTAKFVNQTVAEYYGLISTIKRYFGMLRPDRFRRYGRQENGEEIDLDAVIEAIVESKAGTSPSGGFYIRRDKKERDVAVGFLLDLSYSTEEVIQETGKTLLEIEKESVIVMAEALEVLGDKYAIYGFNSDSRDKVNFYVVKDFEESYTFEVKQRFGGLQSYGMTRIASAVRHAIFKLQKVQAAIKILILLSDGRPFDFDYNSGLTKDYEQFYPETDTRMALREAKMKGINSFCITVDRKGQEYLDYIYGNVSYIIIDDVKQLPNKLTEIYKNLTT